MTTTDACASDACQNRSAGQMVAIVTRGSVGIRPRPRVAGKHPRTGDPAL